MIGTKWAIGAGLLLLIGGSGCVSCGHEVCKPALEAGPCAEAPLCDRRHVYAFLINGVTPAGSSGLDGLRMKLAERGYDKVYCGGLAQGWWMAGEMKRLRSCDPMARFVVVGYDVGCGSAMSLARHADRHGWPIDALVLLDPISMRNTGVHTVVIRSGAEPVAAEVGCVCIPSGHWTLPTHVQTVDAIADVLKDAAAKVEHPAVVEEGALMLDGVPLREMPAAVEDAGADWLFLNDQFGTHTRPLSPLPR